MSHPRAKLTEFGRQLLVERVVCGGYSAALAAELQGVSRATAYKWLRRYKQEGAAGLGDRSCRAKRLPHALPAETVERILHARREKRYGPHRLAPHLGLARSTIYGVLRRCGVSRLQDFDRVTLVPVRYVREHPGELLHVDVKKLARIPPGGGHRILGRVDGMGNSVRTRIHGRGSWGFDYLHVAVDDASRVAFVRVFQDERASSTSQFLEAAGMYFAERKVRIQRVLTDRAMAYTMAPAFAAAVQDLGAKHKVTRPYRPQTNGKAERFIRTMLTEWAYSQLYRTNEERLAALPTWVEFYNAGRPHTALEGQTPLQALVNKADGNYS